MGVTAITSSRRWLLTIAVAAAPPLMVAATIDRFGVDVPFGDQWELVPLLQQVSERQIEATAFLAQHNEHRPVLPRLIMVGLARLTGWNTRYELAINFLIALANLGAFTALLWQTVRPVAPAAMSALVLMGSMAIFSLAQWENWIWGWQIAIFVNVLAALAAVWAVTAYAGRWRGVGLSLLAAAVGMSSFANGLLLSMVLPLGIAVSEFSDGRCSWGSGRRLAVAVLGGAGLVALYLRGFHAAIPLPAAVSQPWTQLHYVLVYLGSSLALGSVTLAIGWGGFGLLALVFAATHTWRGGSRWRSAALPWLLLALYAVLSAGMTAIGRAHMGVTQATASRYVTISILFWLGVGVLVALTVARRWQSARVPERSAIVGVLTALVLAALGGYTRSTAEAWGGLVVHNRAALKSRACLRQYRGAPDHCLRWLYPNPQIVRGRAAWLEQELLSVFAQKLP